MRIETHSLNQPHPQVYNGNDCLQTYEINDREEELPDDGWRLIDAFERGLQGPVLEMMWRGIRVDPAARELAIRSLKSRIERVEVMLKAWTESLWDVPYNKKFPNSGKQLKEFFYDHMGLPRIKKMVKGNLTEPMDREALERQADYFPVRLIVAVVLCYRDLTKCLQVLQTEIDNDWRMRQSINIAGTTTGRFSSSKSTIGTGTNLQNITESLRHIFIADEGYKIAGIDKEQIESRYVGWIIGLLFNDWKYLDACESGDLHTTVARMVWKDLDWTGDLKKDRELAEKPFYRHFTRRDATKRLSHGSNYVGKPNTMALHTQIDRDLCRMFQETYFTEFPGIPRFHNWIAGQLQTRHYLINAFGRRRDFFDRPDSEETIRSAVAFWPQSSAVDDTNLGMWRVWRYLGERVQLLNQEHDAVYFQYKPQEEQEILIEAQKLMKVELTAPNGRVFSVPTDIKVGWNKGLRWKQDNTGKLIDINPRGLDKWRP